MREHKIPAITLQLAPSTHASEHMRRIILEAMSSAGLEVTGWVPLEGEADPVSWPRVAQPSLRLIISSLGEESLERSLSSVGLKIGDALARIRESLPGLPLSINIVVDGTKRWFSFRSSDSPEAVRRGATALGGVVASESGALGWDDDAAQWVIV